MVPEGKENSRAAVVGKSSRVQIHSPGKKSFSFLSFEILFILVGRELQSNIIAVAHKGA